MEIKRCPFCGSEDTHLDFSGTGNKPYINEKGFVVNTPFTYIVMCLDCGVRTMEFLEPQMAVKAWNRRAAAATA